MILDVVCCADDLWYVYQKKNEKLMAIFFLACDDWMSVDERSVGGESGGGGGRLNSFSDLAKMSLGIGGHKKMKRRPDAEQSDAAVTSANQHALQSHQQINMRYSHISRSTCAAVTSADQHAPQSHQQINMCRSHISRSTDFFIF